LRVSNCDRPMSSESNGELNPRYRLCWLCCRPKVSTIWGAGGLANCANGGCAGGEIAAVAEILGVDSASGGGSISTDLISCQFDMLEQE